jgi:hypothetical protein
MKTTSTHCPALPTSWASRFKRSLNRPSRGFALIVTLSLMILLTVIAVGLLSLSTVALRSINQANSMATARANARLAMMLAMGDLQKYAGPDQSVTARADILAATHPSKRNWTGVWDVSSLAATPNTPISGAVPAISPTWLVSASGSSTPTHTGAALEAKDIEKGDAVRLVGSGSVDTSVADNGNEIIVPLQKVTSTTADEPNGAYAYWIGDEGVKARINLDSPGYRTSATAKDASYAFAGASRAAIESMETTTVKTPPVKPEDPVKPVDYGKVISAWGSTLYPYIAETAPKLISSGQLPLYTTAANRAVAQAAAKARFHDLTAYSSSILADTAQGGLRQDLTRILADPTKGPLDTAPIFPAAAVSPTPTEIQCLPPVWGRLRYWWQNPIDPATGSLTPALRTSTTPSIAPVVMWAELGLAFFAENLSLATPPGTGHRIRVQAFPRAILWNPYTVPMVGGTYELCFTGNTGNINLENDVPKPIGSFSLTRNGFNPSAARRDFRFTVTVTQPLAPGQARVFSFNTPGGPTLTEGDFPANYTILNTLPGIDFLDTTEPPPYRINSDKDVPANRLGVNIGFYLRASGVPATSPNYTNVYQWMPSTGIGPNIDGAGKTIPMPAVGVMATQPHLRVVNMTEMNLSTVYGRWLANNNNIAVVLNRHIDDGSNTFFRSGVVSPSNNTMPSTATGDVTVTTRLFSTPSPSSLTLREPRLPDAGLYQSIAQLQHAPVSDQGSGSLNAIGNSLVNPRILRERTFVTTTGSAYILVTPLYDTSYLLNQALWDKYFFSTVPTFTAANLTLPLPNARLQPLPTASVASLNDHTTTAANLMLLGGFNINSTSEQAWRAVLGAAQNLKYDPVTGALAPSSPLSNPFSRFSKPLGNSTDRFRGYRQLTDAQIASLAARMVDEVKKRGPFRSLADFVNRRLVSATDPSTTADVKATGLKGTLQAAIDYADWDTTPAKQINNIAPYTTDILGKNFSPREEDWVGVPGFTNTGKAPTSSRHAFGPGYVSQADVLSRIGSAISARSDTFVIRTYGEARNQSGTAKAYCEAVVQRTPDYVDPSSTVPEAIPAAGSINKRFGRRFTIVSFRWLSPNEI